MITDEGQFFNKTYLIFDQVKLSEMKMKMALGLFQFLIESVQNYFFQAEVPREEMYFISPEQYHEDTKFIRDIEEALLGTILNAFIKHATVFDRVLTIIHFNLTFQSNSQYRNLNFDFSGSFVVVRDNSDGLYRRGMVTRATGRSYEISLNGDTILQVRNY